MTKRTAHGAIDFTRLMQVKDRFAPPELLAPTETETDAGAGQGSAPVLAPPMPAAPPARSAEALGTVIDFPFEGPSLPDAVPAPAPRAAPTEPPVASLPVLGAGTSSALTPDAGAVGSLRVGMSRALHERVRAAAALACVPATTWVRDLLESAAPRFDPASPLAALARTARDAFPAAGEGRRPVDVRMQVPAGEDLHRRLVQLAALRTQTLAVCLAEALEHRVPTL